MKKTLLFSVVFAVALGAGVWVYFAQNGQVEQSAMDSIRVGSGLTIKINIENECMFGDYDIMFGDLSLNGDVTADDLLLTVEPIVGSSKEFPVVSKRLTPLEIEFGYKIDFKLPKITSPQHLGVFLCRDRARTGSCAKKAVYDYGQIQDSLGKGGSPRIRRSDKIYFFQYLYGVSGELRFITSAVTTLKDAYAKVDEATSSVRNEKERKALRKRARRLYDSLGSYVVAKEEELGELMLEMTLAKNDMKACQADAPSKVKRFIKVDRKQKPSSVFQNMGFD